MIELGQHFRMRYANAAAAFINATFSRHEVYIRASDSERALLSAQNFALGLFPLTRRGVDSLALQMVPVHGSAPLDSDPVRKRKLFLLEK